MSHNEHYADNKANWNDRATVHAGSAMYRLDEFIEDRSLISRTVTYDRDFMPNVEGLSVAHLQCHIGTDTISFDRLGAAKVIGLDFSDTAVAEGRRFAEAAGSSTQFVEASVYDAPAAIGSTVDFVYTSIGAISWLHDIDSWAQAVGGLLEPGGQFYIRDVHPFVWIFEEIDGKIVPHFNYWHTDDPLSWDEAETYTDDPDGVGITNTKHHEWNHSLPDIVNALVNAGLRIDRMDEHRGAPWEIFPSAVREGDLWYLPEPLRSQVPVLFSLNATKL